WYGTPARDGSYEHWAQGGHLPPGDISSNYYPARGLYSSDDPAVLDAQMAEIAAAGVGEVVSSWWGRWGVGAVTDERLPLIIQTARAHGLSVAVQIEPYDAGRTRQSLEDDFVRLKSLGITRFYVYRPFDLTDADWTALNAEEKGPGVEVLAQTANVARAAADGFTGVYTYDIYRYGPGSFQRLCRRARAARLTCAPSVGPGYVARRATGDPRVKLRRDGAVYDAMWSAAIRAHPDRVTITSYNEWHEGTQIEPARPTPTRTLAMSPTLRLRYESYDGAYGLHGSEAEDAYLRRTAYWTARLRATASSRP